MPENLRGIFFDSHCRCTENCTIRTAVHTNKFVFEWTLYTVQPITNQSPTDGSTFHPRHSVRHRRSQVRTHAPVQILGRRMGIRHRGFHWRIWSRYPEYRWLERTSVLTHRSTSTNNSSKPHYFVQPNSNIQWCLKLIFSEVWSLKDNAWSLETKTMIQSQKQAKQESCAIAKMTMRCALFVDAYVHYFAWSWFWSNLSRSDSLYWSGADFDRSQ